MEWAYLFFLKNSDEDIYNNETGTLVRMYII